MGQAIGEILPAALGIAISPLTIVTVILMLFTPRAKSLGLAFLIGWMIGLAAMGVLVLVTTISLNLENSSDGGSPVVSILKLILGVVLLGLGYREWKHRPTEDGTPKLPRWMQTVDEFTAAKSFGLSAFLSGVSPKNLAFTLAACISIAQLQLPTDATIAALTVFDAIASISVAIPVIWYLLDRERAAASLTRWREWLTVNNTAMVAVLLLVLGVTFVGKGISGLSM